MDFKNLLKYAEFAATVIIIVMVVMAIRAFVNAKEPEVTVKLQQPEFLLEETPDDVLYDALIHYEVLFPEIVFAQAVLETGHFKSYNCVENNNLFGLYNNRKGKYFIYDHWAESIIDYKKYIQYKYKEGEDYYKFLERIGYAEDSLYVNKVKDIVRRYDQRKNNARYVTAGKP